MALRAGPKSARLVAKLAQNRLPTTNAISQPLRRRLQPGSRSSTAKAETRITVTAAVTRNWPWLTAVRAGSCQRRPKR